jgi:hypothetical protein
MIRKHRTWLLMALGAAGLVGGLYAEKRLVRPYSVDDRMARLEEPVRLRLDRDFRAAEAAWPPKRLDFLAFKLEKRLEVYVPGKQAKPVFLKSYPVLAASGSLGPKLREGDMQVPEGIYRVEYLNPNSRFHLSMKLDYPNADDRNQARAEGRTRLGGDIMIHGNHVSIGCLAVGDPAAEELFVLAALAGVDQVRVLIAPVDFRQRGLPPDLLLPSWTDGLYKRLASELKEYPVGNSALTDR